MLIAIEQFIVFTRKLHCDCNKTEQDYYLKLKRRKCPLTPSRAVLKFNIVMFTLRGGFAKAKYGICNSVSHVSILFRN